MVSGNQIFFEKEYLIMKKKHYKNNYKGAKIQKHSKEDNPEFLIKIIKWLMPI